jgi:CheY-like chemotaxis protein
MHGGTVTAHSDGPGTGAEFVVRLPALVEDEAPGEPVAERTAPEPAVKRRILVVDDNVDSATTLAMLLSMHGNEVDVAFDGAQAIESANRMRPDVILLDLGMPKMNGYDACRRIREKPWSRNTLLVAVTGWGQENDRRRTSEAGFDAHIVKPIDDSLLEETLVSLTPAAIQHAAESG